MSQPSYPPGQPNVHTPPAAHPPGQAPPKRTRNSTVVIIAATLVVAAVAVLLVVKLAAGVVGSAPTAADAEWKCKQAAEEWAPQHLELVLDGGASVTATVDGVDMGKAEKRAGGWTVEGQIHFTRQSVLGTTPVDVGVTCDAMVNGHRITADVHSR